MAIDSVIHTNEQSIGRVLQTGLPLALVFWSKSQVPSAGWETILETAAHDYAGKLLIAKVDADTENALRQRYQVQALPAIVVIKHGEVETIIDQQSDAEKVKSWLQYSAVGGQRPTQNTETEHKGAANGSSSYSSASQSNGVPITLTDANFDQVIQGNRPVLVDFWAPWCGPCRMVAPAVEEMAKSFEGRAIVGKLNVDENPRTAQRYQIMGIPALYIFKNGAVIEQMVGVQPAATLRQQLTRHTS